ncbi:branched-chain amino acid transport system II carrier protein [Clostridium sp. KNHs214]|uniref:branched-chain amino acid transport system II carrier protein n=1 Tax=Clostridium sp. KNHs214 TaxID=1540257 RepID=UPI00068B2C88|nr:branched-chain amino acid transport system II carrier protein [Clostridium sp. KNHs214]
MSKKNKDALVVGLALFAMFFGAGNLIFPPELGMQSGSKWMLATLGFFLIGIGMPLLGIMAVSRAGGSIDKLCSKVSPTFSKILGTVIVLCIGPFLAIPRTGATTFEMGISPIFPGLNSVIFSIIYFSVTLFFVIKPSGIVDKIGKILTPALLAVLALIIFKGIISPMANPGTPFIKNAFSSGFVGGYQTMDAMGSILMAGIVLKSLIDKGYKEPKVQMKLAFKSSLIAALGLAFVYGGLLYLGATSNTVFPQNITKTQLVMNIAESTLGGFGSIALAICVTLACLTTSIGLTATTGNYFNELTKGKVSYEKIVIITTVISAILANVGVEKIVRLSMPVLVAVYPITIVLIVMNMFDNLIRNKGAYIGAVYGALFVSLFDAMSALGFNTSFIGNFMNIIPLSQQGFAWIVPSIIGGILFSLMRQKKKGLIEE